MTTTTAVEAPRTDQDLRAYFDLLKDLGLDCPSAKAVEAWQRAQAIGDEARRVRQEETPGPLSLARRLGRGEVTVKEVEKRFPSVLTSTAKTYQEARLRLYLDARKEAVKATWEALRETGAELLEGPERVISETLANPDSIEAQERRDVANRVLTLIHGFGIPRSESDQRAEVSVAKDIEQSQPRKAGAVWEADATGRHHPVRIK